MLGNGEFFDDSGGRYQGTGFIVAILYHESERIT